MKNIVFAFIVIYKKCHEKWDLNDCCEHYSFFVCFCKICIVSCFFCRKKHMFSMMCRWIVAVFYGRFLIGTTANIETN